MDGKEAIEYGIVDRVLEKRAEVSAPVPGH
jgi:ATP-dependent protease ClpP protease subunit